MEKGMKYILIGLGIFLIIGLVVGMYMFNNSHESPSDGTVSAYICERISGDGVILSFSVNSGESCRDAYDRLQKGTVYDTQDAITVCPKSCECYTATGCKIVTGLSKNNVLQTIEASKRNGINLFNIRII